MVIRETREQLWQSSYRCNPTHADSCVTDIDAAMGAQHSRIFLLVWRLFKFPHTRGAAASLTTSKFKVSCMPGCMSLQKIQRTA